MKEESDDDREDDVFVFCSKGETAQVLDLVRTGKVDVNQKDEDMGMTLLIGHVIADIFLCGVITCWVRISTRRTARERPWNGSFV